MYTSESQRTYFYATTVMKKHFKTGGNLNGSTMVKNKFGVHRKWPRIKIEVVLMHKKRDSQSSKNASVVKTHTTHVKISHEVRVLWSVTSTKNSVEYVIKYPCKLLRFHSNDRFVKHFLCKENE